MSLESTTNYYHREYKNDLPRYAGWLDTGKRLAVAALPFITLYEPVQKPMTLALGTLRTLTGASNLYSNWSQLSSKDVAYASLPIVYSTISVAGTVFAHPLGIGLTTAQDICTEVRALIWNFHQGNKTKALENCMSILNNSLYLALVSKGTLELSVAFLAVQVVSGLYHSLSEFNNGKYIEGVSRLLMSSICGHQFIGQYKLLQAKWKTETNKEVQNKNLDITASLSPEDQDKVEHLLATAEELVSQNKLAEIIDVLDAALAIDPQNPNLWRGRSFIQLQLNNPTQAVSDLTIALEFCGDQDSLSMFYIERGFLNCVIKDYSAAQQDFTTAGELGNPYAQELLTNFETWKDFE